jgi:hypothetical protein
MFKARQRCPLNPHRSLEQRLLMTEMGVFTGGKSAREGTPPSMGNEGCMGEALASSGLSPQASRLGSLPQITFFFCVVLVFELRALACHKSALPLEPRPSQNPLVISQTGSLILPQASLGPQSYFHLLRS